MELKDEFEKLVARFRGRRVYIAGHRGMVGAALVRAMEPLDAQLIKRTSAELDLRNQAATAAFFASERPEIVLFAAAKVGGIQANATAPAEFLYDNLAMATHAIQSAYEFGTERFVFLGSTCIYPRLAPQPMPESALMTSELEPTNEGYALAKIVGLKLCQMYRRQYGVLFHSLMPTNLYGPGDNYHPDHAHVLPALIRRIHQTQEEGQPTVTIWGSGRPLRELLHVDDLAAATLHVAALEDPPDWLNVGSGDELSILELAKMVADIAGYQGEIVVDSSRPDGTPRKLADASRLRATGWQPKIPLREGIERTYQDFVRERERGLLRVK
ncbi:MAG: GDP-L-fucose synthase [Pirellulales bacterium]